MKINNISLKRHAGATSPNKEIHKDSQKQRKMMVMMKKGRTNNLKRKEKREEEERQERRLWDREADIYVERESGMFFRFSKW